MKFLFLTLLLAIAFAQPGGTEPEECKYLIKGLGFAGAEFIYQLEEDNEHDWCVIEAEDTYGGRCKVVDVAGNNLASGCGWEAGSGHLMSDRLTQFGIDRFKQRWDSWLDYDRDGNEVSLRYGDYEVALACADVLGAAVDAGQLRNMHTEAAFAECGWFNADANDDLVEWGYHDYEYATPAVSAGLQGSYPLLNYELYDGMDNLITDQGGYERVIKELLLTKGVDVNTDSRISYNSRITNVDMDNKLATVIDPQGDEYQIHYDTMFDTMPLGAIQYDLGNNAGNAYTPRISGDVAHFFANHIATDYARIYFTFPEKFWANWQFYNIAPTANNRCSVWQNLDLSQFYPGSKTLFLTCTSPTAESVVDLTEAQAIDLFMPDLRKVFGSDIPDPTTVVLTGWHKNHQTRGGYSAIAPTVKPTDFEAVAQWGNDKGFYYAGEASCQQLWGYVHGAAESARYQYCQSKNDPSVDCMAQSPCWPDQSVKRDAPRPQQRRTKVNKGHGYSQAEFGRRVAAAVSRAQEALGF